MNAATFRVEDVAEALGPFLRELDAALTGRKTATVTIDDDGVVTVDGSTRGNVFYAEVDEVGPDRYKVREFRGPYGMTRACYVKDHYAENHEEAVDLVSKSLYDFVETAGG